MSKPNELDATTLASLTRSGTLAVEDVAKAIIARVDARGEEVQAYAWFDRDQIVTEGRRLDAAETKGPLHGVPIGVKDVINTKDMPTQHNTSRYRDSRPGVDAACVDMLRTAGALIVGKTVTTEFATTNRGGPTRNPIALDCTPGGSSSGSAAAVADFQATIALGTQTGGSTIRPASFCGIYGWKPTWNSISREGLKMYSATCDTLGLYARSADDLALLADVFRLDALEQAAPRGLAGMRIGVCRSPVWHKAMPATEAAMASGIASLRDAGAVVSEVALPAPFEAIHDAHRKILRREGRAAFLNEYAATPDIHDDFRAIVENRDDYSIAEMRAAYRLADECRLIFDDIAAGYDLILTPSVTGEAPEGIELTGDASFNSMWTLLQVPVVNVPGFTGPNGRPVGLSLVARRYQDRKVIACAKLVGAAFMAEQSKAA
jgi:Asp-tRNA(Asn)/Glu-tRNA(Gln) amidotransferase A subunit family amidase